jgi:benzoyl-CoA reductase/2-hydroxyglutaryl-CoA dehydratase subunit BcrC/BadD/HgdB
LLDQNHMSPFIGLTSTVPVEIIYAAGLTPIDLNNIFISSEKSESLVKQAELKGFSHNVCSWIKGIYSAALNNNISQVIAVTGGDCSNTIALAEILSRKGVKIISFEYPLDRNREFLAAQMEKLRASLATTWDKIETARLHLERIREKLRTIDRLAYEEDIVTGLENHLFLVSGSDFRSDPDQFEKELDIFIEKAKKRLPFKDKIRLGYLGVPPIFTGFYEFIESLDGRVVYNEVQRQFIMPSPCGDIVEQYLKYTYPYDIGGRIEDIKRAVDERKLDGLIHYTQTFCFRQLYDMIIREISPVPVLTLEGDRPGKIDSRIALRIETFMEMLKDRK